MSPVSPRRTPQRALHQAPRGGRRLAAGAAVVALSTALLGVGLGAPAQAGSTSGSVRSAGSVVAADSPAEVTQQPESQTVDSGEDATFTAAASGSPEPTVQWQESASGPNFHDIPGATDTTLVVSGATTALSGHTYRAVFFNGGEYAGSDPATLTVNPLAPSVTEDVADQTVRSGEDAVFTATADGDPAPQGQWQVSTDDGVTFQDIRSATGSSLTVYDVTLAQDGEQYRVVFTNSDSSVTSSAGLLTVDPSVPVITSQPADQTVLAGDAASFTAGAQGDPSPTLQWQELAPGPDEEWTDLEGETGDVLRIDSPSKELNGHQYRFVASNGAVDEDGEPLDTASSAATLTVTGQEPGAPTGLVVTQGKLGLLNYSWTAPSFLGNPTLTGYGIGYSGGEWGNGRDLDGTATTGELEDVPTGRYTFSVAAINAAGRSLQTSTTTPVVVYGVSPSLEASATRRTAGQGLTLSGLGKPGLNVMVQRQLPGGSWLEVKDVTVTSASTWSWTTAVTSSARYRVRYVDDLPASDEVGVTVATKVSLGATRVAKRTYSLHGGVYPVASRQLVKVYVKSGSHYVYLGSDRTDSRGRWSYRKRFGSTKTYTLKALASATTRTAAGSVVHSYRVR